MAARFFSKALWLAVVQAQDLEVETSQLTYGKYFSSKSGSKDTTDNSYFLFKPKDYDASVNGKLPIIIEIHGGGFTGGSPQKSPNAAIQSAVNNGIAYVSVGYRLVATKYYYDSNKVEELIHVDSEGRLSLDTSGKTMDDYQVRVGRTEFNTKCSYDTAQMIEHLIANADTLGLDVHRISTTGGSAGGGEIHYLTWVYHQWNADRYTPRGMVYNMAQLDYPVQNMLDRVWTLWTDDVGESTKLSTILSKDDCSMIIGNPWCEQSADYNLCNQTYNSMVTGRFCGSNFDSVTLGEVRDTCVWPKDDPEVGKGMEVLWYNSLNMQKHQPKPFYLYIENALNSTAGMNVVHSALYSRNYAKYAEMAGINYTVYYTDYHGMTEDDAGEQRFQSGNKVYNYRSSHDWASRPEVQKSGHANPTEQLMYHCLALGVECSSSPSPTPSPSPSPSPSPGVLSDACKEKIDENCPSGSDCQSCITSKGAQFWIGVGCPRGAGAAAQCIEYCNSKGSDVLV